VQLTVAEADTTAGISATRIESANKDNDVITKTGGGDPPQIPMIHIYSTIPSCGIKVPRLEQYVFMMRGSLEDRVALDPLPRGSRPLQSSGLNPSAGTEIRAPAQDYSAKSWIAVALKYDVPA
jgi:hypothetical protein